MARFTSAVVAFGESPDNRVLRDALFIVKSGESENVLWVAFETRLQARFQVWVSLSPQLVAIRVDCRLAVWLSMSGIDELSRVASSE